MRNSSYILQFELGEYKKSITKIIKDRENQKKTTCYKKYNNQLLQKLLKNQYKSHQLDGQTAKLD